MRKWTGCAVFLVGLLWTAGAQSPEVRTVFHTERTEGGGWSLTVGGVSVGPQRMAPGAPALTPDGKHNAVVTAPAGPDPLFRLLVDGKTVAEWTAYSNVGTPALRDDGASWAVDARFGNGGNLNAFKLVDNRAFGPFRQTEAMVWSPGGRWYFRTELEQGRGLVVDGKAFGPVQNLQNPAWDATGTRLAFVFQRNGSWYVWAAGKEAGPFPSAQLITRPDGAWIGYSSTAKDNRITVTVDGKAYGPFDWIDPGLDWVNADGKKWTSRASRKGVWSLLDTGKETKLPSLSFARLPAGGSVYRWGSFQNWSLNINGQVLGPYDTPSTILGFQDGSSWAFSYLALGKPANRFEPAFVQVKGLKPLSGWDLKLIKDAEGEAFVWTSGGQDAPLVLNRWGSGGLTAKVLYTVTQGPAGWTLTADGRDLGPYLDLSRPVVTGAGSHWGVVVRWADGGSAVVVDGTEGPVSRPVERADGLVLSENGAGWSYWAWPSKGSDQQIRITNGVETGPFRWAGNPALSSDGIHSQVWTQTLDGKNQLFFDGKSYGPYVRGEERHLYDLEAGRFVFGLQEKAGLMAVTNEGTFGPYQGLEPLPKRLVPPDANTGGLFGFVGTLKDGRSELRVVSGLVGGGKTYGPYRRMDRRPAYLADDGQDWIYGFEKEGSPGQWFLHNGTEVSSDGYAVKPLGPGYLMMVRKDGMESLVRNGLTVGAWTHVFDWSVAGDGRTWVAEVQEGDGPGSRNLVVFNGTAQPGSNLVHRTGPDGERYTWFSLTEEGDGRVHSVTVPLASQLDQLKTSWP